MKRFTLLLFVVVLTGCANYQPVPDDYTGPTATIDDSGFSEDGSKAQMFVLVAVDGRLVRNSLIASRERSFGQGFRLSTIYVDRQVPIRAMKLKLLATHTTAAPIQELFSLARGTFFSVEGVVTFTPEPGGYYIVKGELKEDGSSVWLEDGRNGGRVTERIVEK